MPSTLRKLLSSPAFGLRAVGTIDAATLDRPLLWAHSSDLPDPTPWLDTGGLLLTDGAQFASPHETTGASYVERLVARGVVALGFATGIVHDRIPDPLVRAADKAGLALIEVSRDTPFMAIIRSISDAVSNDDREDLERSLRAQRSVARAALRPNGLGEIVRELEQNLDCWVTLFDASGMRMRIPTRLHTPESLSDQVQSEVERMLQSGRTSAARLSLASYDLLDADRTEVTLQTLGTTGNLRGVLAVGTGTGALDRARTDLVDAVIALASIALEQSRTLDDARRRLRSGVLELLVAGMTDVARQTVRQLWGELPAEPIRVGFISASSTHDDGFLVLRSALDLLAADQRDSLFYAEQGSTLVTITSADSRSELLALLARTESFAGFSAEASWASLPRAMGEAQTALSHADKAQPTNDFDELAKSGLFGHLMRTSAHEIAHHMLLPLSEATSSLPLRHTLSVWLEHNAAWDPAARSLGIHRHTLRARVDAASTLLGLDLDTFAARAELWSALKLTEPVSPR